MGVDIVTTSLWLLKDLFWVVRFTWVAWAFGALAVLSQLKNFVAVFHEEFAKPTPYKLLRAFVVRRQPSRKKVHECTANAASSCSNCARGNCTHVHSLHTQGPPTRTYLCLRLSGQLD